MSSSPADPRQMGQAPLPRLIPRLALPTVAAMLANSVYNMADSFFAARLGAAAAGGVGVVFPLLSVLQAVGFTAALGGSTWVSRLLGKGEGEKAGQVASATFWLAVGLAAALGAIGWFFVQPLCRLAGATETILPYAVAYARPIALSAPLMGGCYALSCLLRSGGKAIGAMVGVVTGGLLNAALDPLFLFGFSLGVAGAGYATLAGQGVSFLILLIPFLKKNAPFCLSPRQASPSPGEYLTILKNGMSSFFRQATTGVGIMLLNRSAAMYGDSAVAGIAAAGKLATLVYSAFLGWGQGYQPVAGYCYGGGNAHRLKKAFRFTLLSGTGLILLPAAACFFFAPTLIGWLGAGDPTIQQVGTASLRAQALFMPLIPLGVLTNMTVQAADRPVTATLLACCRQGFCLIPVIWLFNRVWGLPGLRLTQGVADGLTFLIALPVAIRFFKKQRELGQGS